MQGAPPTLFTRVATWVLAHGRTIALVVFGVLIVAGGGVARTTLDFSSTSFYGGGDRDLRDLEEFVDRWGADDRDLSVLVTADDTAGVLTVQRLEVMSQIAARLADDPDVTEVVALPDVLLSPGGPTVLERARTLPNAADRLAARRRLVATPRIVPLLLSEDGRHAVLVVRLAHSTDDLGPTVQTVDRVSAVVDEFSEQDGLRVRLAGVPAIRGAFFSLTIRDQMVFVPVTMALVGLVLYAAYRRTYAVIVPGLAAGLPLLVLLGVMGWAGEPIGLLNQAYFTVLPVIAIADAVHLVERAHEELRAGRPPGDAVRAAVGHVGWACLLTSLTTGAGFASLAISPMPILRNFGLFAALGIGLAYASVLFVMPPILAFALARSAAPRPPRGRGRLRGLVRGLLARRVWVLASFALVLATAGWGARSVVVDNRLTELLQPDHPVAEASEVLDRELAGILSLEVDIQAPAGSSVVGQARPHIEEFADWAADQAETRAVLGPLFDGDRARLSVRTADIGGRAFGRLRRRFRSEADERFASLDLDVRLTGTPAVAYRGINRITADLRRSLLLLFAIVTVLIGALLRSLRLALVSILPNVFPLVVAYGAIGWTTTTLDPLALVILTVALGIAVDDTIHVAARYAAERRAGVGRTQAIEISVEATGRAVIVTSLTLTIGLAVNQASSFPPLQMLGWLGSTAIAVALVADLGLLPILLAGRLAGPGRGRESGPAAESFDPD